MTTNSVTPVFGKYTDQDVVDWVEKTPFQVKGNPMYEHMSKDWLLKTHPMVSHLCHGTQPALTVGCKAPDGILHELNGDRPLTLHDILQQKSMTPYVLLSFGSYT